MTIPAPPRVWVDLEEFWTAMLIQTPVEPTIVAALQALKEGETALDDRPLGLLGEACGPRYDLPVW